MFPYNQVKGFSADGEMRHCFTQCYVSGARDTPNVAVSPRLVLIVDFLPCFITTGGVADEKYRTIT